VGDRFTACALTLSAVAASQACDPACAPTRTARRSTGRNLSSRRGAFCVGMSVFGGTSFKSSSTCAAITAQSVRCEEFLFHRSFWVRKPLHQMDRVVVTLNESTEGGAMRAVYPHVTDHA